jgi:hypothetical protein
MNIINLLYHKNVNINVRENRDENKTRKVKEKSEHFYSVMTI